MFLNLYKILETGVTVICFVSWVIRLLV